MTSLPPALSLASTPIELDAGIASILTAVLDMMILLSARETGNPFRSNTNTWKLFSPDFDKGKSRVELLFTICYEILCTSKYDWIQ